MPQEDDPYQVIVLETTLKTNPWRFLHNRQGIGTRTSGPRINITI